MAVKISIVNSYLGESSMTQLYKYLVLFLFFGPMHLKANPIVATLDQFVVSSDGIYVNLDDAIIPVESITLANDGYVVALPKPQAAICPKCGQDAYSPGRTCSNCGFPIWNKKPT